MGKEYQKVKTTEKIQIARTSPLLPAKYYPQTFEELATTTPGRGNDKFRGAFYYQYQKGTPIQKKHLTKFIHQKYDKARSRESMLNYEAIMKENKIPYKQREVPTEEEMQKRADQKQANKFKVAGFDSEGNLAPDAPLGEKSRKRTRQRRRRR